MAFGCQDLEPAILESEPGDPLFVGSSTALLRELRDLQDISRIELGSAPERYDEMLADLRKFYRSMHSGADFQLNDEDCFRWVWLALRDGAERAIRQNTVLWSGPG